jgi:hypothetical protein
MTDKMDKAIERLIEDLNILISSPEWESLEIEDCEKPIWWDIFHIKWLKGQSF